MKKSLTILFLSIAMCGCKHKTWYTPRFILSADTVKQQQYHIRVECFGKFTSFDGQQYYTIKYTLNNWETSSELPDTFDALGWCYQLRLSTNKKELIDLAKRISTSKSAIHYRDSVYHLFIEKTKGSDCCNPVQVY